MGFQRSQLEPCPGLIIGLTGHEAPAIGVITLPIIVGEGARTATQMAQFTVIDMELAYNGIIGRPLIHDFRAILSQYYQMIKFPTPEGPGIWHSNQAVFRSCYLTAARGKTGSGSYLIEMLDGREDLIGSRPSPVEDTCSVHIGEGKSTNVGSHLSPEVKDKLTNFLKLMWMCLSGRQNYCEQDSFGRLITPCDWPTWF